jgi:hypothetical protein
MRLGSPLGKHIQRIDQFPRQTVAGGGKYHRNVLAPGFIRCPHIALVIGTPRPRKSHLPFLGREPNCPDGGLAHADGQVNQAFDGVGRAMIAKPALTFAGKPPSLA